jgi:hypothetical protein
MPCRQHSSLTETRGLTFSEQILRGKEVLCLNDRNLSHGDKVYTCLRLGK